MLHVNGRYADPGSGRWGGGARSFGRIAAGRLTPPPSGPLELVDVEGEFEGGAELQAHVFHHHVAAQQQEGFTVNLLRQRGRDKES